MSTTDLVLPQRPRLDDWQRELNDHGERRFADPDCRHIQAAPTGTGKTEMGIDLLLRYRAKYPMATLAWLSNREILRNESAARLREAGLATLDQTSEKGAHRGLAPNVVNMITDQTFVMRDNKKQGIRHRKHHRPCAYDTRTQDQLIEIDEFNLDCWGLLIADEAHHGIADYYGSCVRAWNGPVIGLTATPWLLSPYNALGEGMAGPQDQSGPWQTLEFSPPARELMSTNPFKDKADIKDGKRLSDCVVIRPDHYARIQHSNLKVAIGNQDGYDGGSVDAEVERLIRYRLATGPVLVRDWEERADKRPILVYCRTKKAAKEASDLWIECGYKAAWVIAETPEDERRRLLDALQAGELDCLASVDVFGEGVNVPNINCVGMLRPTQSLTRHRQFLGRGLRRRPDGSPLTVLDWADNIEQNGSPLGNFNEMGLGPRKIREGNEKRLFPTQCKECGQSCVWSEKECKFCGAPISWICSDTVLKNFKIKSWDKPIPELKVAGHHTREYWKRFNLSATTCDDAIIQAYQTYKDEQRRFEQEERDKRAKEREEADRKWREQQALKQQWEEQEALKIAKKREREESMIWDVWQTPNETEREQIAAKITPSSYRGIKQNDSTHNAFLYNTGQVLYVSGSSLPQFHQVTPPKNPALGNSLKRLAKSLREAQSWLKDRSFLTNANLKPEDVVIGETSFSNEKLIDVEEGKPRPDSAIQNGANSAQWYGRPKQIFIDNHFEWGVEILTADDHNKNLINGQGWPRVGDQLDVLVETSHRTDKNRIGPHKVLSIAKDFSRIRCIAMAGVQWVAKEKLDDVS